VLGLGAVPGAVYFAESATEFPLVDCVVTTINVPQELPLQPGPLSAQDSAGLGFEPGTGVKVATIVASLLPARWMAQRVATKNCW